MDKLTKYAIVATAIATLGNTAWAAKSSGNDALAIEQAKVLIAQAISVAEKVHSGKASKAEFEHTKQGWVYEVEVVSGAKVFDVTVDADKGTILSSAEDMADHENGSDEDRDDDRDEKN